MKIAIYARVSKETCNQCSKVREECTCAEYKGQTTENQLRELRAFAESSGWTITREYIDHESAKSGDRDQFQKMLADSSKRKFKAVLVWSLDRFTREGIEATFGYVRQLKTGGVDFVSYSEPHFRTTGPAGELMLAVAAWIAQQERRRISERTKAGMATARLKGKHVGRPFLDVDQAEILERHAAGAGVMKIANAMTEAGRKVSRETVRRTLRRAEAATA